MTGKCPARAVGEDGVELSCSLPYPHTGGHWHPKVEHWPVSPAEVAAQNRRGIVPQWAAAWLLAYIAPLLLPLVVILWLAAVGAGAWWLGNLIFD